MVRPQEYSPKLDAGTTSARPSSACVREPRPGLAPLAGHVGERATWRDRAGQPRCHRRRARRAATAPQAGSRTASRRAATALAPPVEGVGEAHGERQPDQRVGLVDVAEGHERAVEQGLRRGRQRGGDRPERARRRGRTTPTARVARRNRRSVTPRSESPASPTPGEQGRRHDEDRTGGHGVPRRPPLAARGDDEPEPVRRAAGDVEEVDLAHDVGRCARSSPGRAATTGPRTTSGPSHQALARTTPADHHQVTGARPPAPPGQQPQPGGHAPRGPWPSR